MVIACTYQWHNVLYCACRLLEKPSTHDWYNYGLFLQHDASYLVLRRIQHLPACAWYLLSHQDGDDNTVETSRWSCETSLPGEVSFCALRLEFGGARLTFSHLVICECIRHRDISRTDSTHTKYFVRPSQIHLLRRCFKYHPLIYVFGRGDIVVFHFNYSILFRRTQYTCC